MQRESSNAVRLNSRRRLDEGARPAKSGRRVDACQPGLQVVPPREGRCAHRAGLRFPPKRLRQGVYARERREVLAFACNRDRLAERPDCTRLALDLRMPERRPVADCMEVERCADVGGERPRHGGRIPCGSPGGDPRIVYRPQRSKEVHRDRTWRAVVRIEAFVCEVPPHERRAATVALRDTFDAELRKGDGGGKLSVREPEAASHPLTERRQAARLLIEQQSPLLQRVDELRIGAAAMRGYGVLTEGDDGLHLVRKFRVSRPGTRRIEAPGNRGLQVEWPLVETQLAPDDIERAETKALAQLVATPAPLKAGDCGIESRCANIVALGVGDRQNKREAAVRRDLLSSRCDFVTFRIKQGDGD